MKTKDVNMVKEMGFRPNVKGYRCMIELIDMAVSGYLVPGSLVKIGYYEIAKKHGTTPKSVERTVRYALNIAHNEHPEKFEEFLMLKERPANGEFIFSMADRIQNENHI